MSSLGYARVAPSFADSSASLHSLCSRARQIKGESGRERRERKEGGAIESSSLRKSVRKVEGPLTLGLSGNGFASEG